PVVSLPRLGEFLIRRYQRLPADQRVSGTLSICYYDVSQVEPERYAIEVTAQVERDAMPHAIRALARSTRALTAEQLFRPGPLSPWREAGRIAVPALVIYGTHDILVRPQMAVRARKAFRTAKVVVLENTGHVAQMERPGTVAALITQMLDGNEVWPAEVDADERSVGRADARYAEN
ncbi:MAG TPA: alpha/beta hydrolase, partial [Streptosporangiaceae bacterium]|nr:alpha/beta hydrolase [Streptosporangiaceae bacterium]